jgi:uncharacterized membrane protein YkvA (DUF1232 family)
MKDNLGERFLQTLGGCLVSLPYDLKVLFEAMSQEDLDRPVRERVTGAIMYMLSPHDAAPQDQPHLSFVDDVVLLRLTLRHVLQNGGDAARAFADRFPEQFETLDTDLETFRAYLGPSYDWLQAKIEALPRMVYKGKRVRDYLDEEEAGAFLYEEGLSFTTDYEVDEEAVGRLKRPESFRQYLERRMAEDGRRLS